MNERTYRQLHPDARLDDGIERARARHYYKAQPPDDRYKARGYMTLVAFCVVWSLFVGWLFNH